LKVRHAMTSNEGRGLPEGIREPIRVTLPSTAGDALISVKRYLCYISFIGPLKILQSVNYRLFEETIILKM
jgi:hypothetical protein